MQVVEGDDDLMMLPGPHDSDEYLETASRRSCSSSALLEAAVSSAVNHPNVVQTYDYRVFDPDAQVLSSSASFRSPLRVSPCLCCTLSVVCYAVKRWQQSIMHAVVLMVTATCGP